MGYQLEEILQISIYLKEKTERINEVALFQPFIREGGFNHLHKTVAQRKWNYVSSDSSLFQRISHELYRLFFKYFPAKTTKERLTTEAKFKTALAYLLAQGTIRDFFLSERKRKEDFIFAVKEAALALGLIHFTLPDIDGAENPMQVSRLLTTLEGKCLVEDLNELHLQMAALKTDERNEILFRILNTIERPPVTSVLEVISSQEIQPIEMTTRYAKYKILYWDPLSGKITYYFSENHATSSVRTPDNTLPDAIGTMNQRCVSDEHQKTWIGAYCGELTTPYHLLEQILWILNEKEGEIYAHDDPSDAHAIEIKILFTSLFSWSEMDQIAKQQAAVRHWDRKVIKTGHRNYRLKLLYFNIPFSSLNKFPTPAETKAVLEDINDEALITLASEWCELHACHCPELEAISQRMHSLKNLHNKEFVPFEKAILEEIDAFKEIKKKLIYQLDSHNSEASHPLRSLLTNQLPNGKPLKGIDKLIYCNILAQELNYYHNKNCKNATEKAASAEAADKAQYAYQKIHQSLFLPGYSTEQEQTLFKILYSLYYVWEEPDINFLLNSDFGQESSYAMREAHKNAEVSRYLYAF